MEERKEINYSDLDPYFEQHNEALKKIKNFNFTETPKQDLLNLVKDNMFTDLEGQEKFELYSSVVVDDGGMPALSVWFVKHLDWVTSEHYYILFSPFDVWVRTNTRNIHYKHKALTTAWCQYLLKTYPLYLAPLKNHLDAERKRLHETVDEECNQMLKLFSIV